VLINQLFWPLKKVFTFNASVSNKIAFDKNLGVKSIVCLLIKSKKYCLVGCLRQQLIFDVLGFFFSIFKVHDSRLRMSVYTCK